MGRNSKAKRDAKRKAERRPTGRTGGPLPAPPGQRLGERLDDVDDAAMNRMFRSSCNECGSGNLSWMTFGELHDHVRDEVKPRVQEGIDMIGADGQAWTCGDCGNFGVMGPAQGSF